MHHFAYREGSLHCEDVPLRELAERLGTPLFVYSSATLLRHIRRFQAAFRDLGLDPLVAYSVKANPNLALIRLLANEGAGADVVSGGELTRALHAGVPPKRIVFAGVGKQKSELRQAVEAGILAVNVEAPGELEHLAALREETGRSVGIALRVNPDVSADTHRYIRVGTHATKFGISVEALPSLLERARALDLDLCGLSCHIGSQILSLDPFRQALARLAELATRLLDEGWGLTHLDVGGGLGVRYRDEEPPSLEAYAEAIQGEVGGLGLRLVAEPGRVIVANAGVLLSRVLYRKRTGEKLFLIADQAMNDLQRPALYGAFHDVWPVREGAPRIPADIVGPICESGDFLTQDREVPDLAAGELFAAMSAGAYGRSMSSNYNTRPRAPEVLVRGDEAHLVQERETVEDLFAGERIPAWLRKGAP